MKKTICLIKKSKKVPLVSAHCASKNFTKA